MLSIAASTRVKSPAGSLSSCLCALLARLTLQASGARSSVLLIRDRFTGSRFGTAAFDGAEFRGRSGGFGNGLVGELLRPDDDGAALGGELDEVAKRQADGLAHGFRDAHLVIAGKAGNGGGLGHGDRVPYNGFSRQGGAGTEFTQGVIRMGVLPGAGRTHERCVEAQGLPPSRFG